MKKNHLTEKDLIEYQFKLASQEQIEKAAKHLRECEKCRRLNERLEAKFSSLELLREEPQLNEELVSRVLVDIKTSRRAKLKSRKFKTSAWMGAAAALLLVASLLVISEIKEQGRSKLKEGLRIDRPQRTEKYAYDDEKIKAERGDDIRRDSRQLGRDFTAGDRIVSNTEDEKLPFALASAIAPVVRPSRENVRFTIHHSVDFTLARKEGSFASKKGWKLADQDGNWRTNLNNGWQMK